MERRGSLFPLSVLCFGIAFLYLPILVLIGYSFNASPLVSVWGGFSTKWYGALFAWPQSRGFSTITLAHIAFCLGYVTVTVQSRLKGADRALEEAAMDLGAGPVGAFLDITLPIIAPAVASGWLLSFTVSIDDLVISQFVAGPGASTLPMVIYSKVKLGVSPDMNALASLVIALVGTGVIIAGVVMRRQERQRLRDMQLASR